MSERYLHVTRANLRAAAEAGRSEPSRAEANADADALLRSVELKATGKDKGQTMAG